MARTNRAEPGTYSRSGFRREALRQSYWFWRKLVISLLLSIAIAFVLGVLTGALVAMRMQ